MHTGFYRDLVEKDEYGQDLVGRITEHLHMYANTKDERLTVNYIGYSRGGPLVAIAAGEMIARNTFDNGNLALGNIITYGSPAYADNEYIERFNRRAKAIGAKHNWAIERAGDTMPRVLTPESTNFFARYMYGQVGERVYIDKGSIIFSPDNGHLSALRNRELPFAHDLKQYEEALSPPDHRKPDVSPNQRPAGNSPHF